MRALLIASIFATGCFSTGTDIRGNYDATMSRTASGCTAPAPTGLETTLHIDDAEVIHIDGAKACSIEWQATDYGPVGSTTGLAGACALQPSGTTFESGGEFWSKGFDVIWKSADGKCTVTDHWDMKKK
jgi:hypothetical protein